MTNCGDLIELKKVFRDLLFCFPIDVLEVGPEKVLPPNKDHDLEDNKHDRIGRDQDQSVKQKDPSTESIEPFETDGQVDSSSQGNDSHRNKKHDKGPGP